MKPETVQTILSYLDKVTEGLGYDSWDDLSKALHAGVKMVGPGVLDSTGKAVQHKLTGDTDPSAGKPYHKAVLKLDSREKLQKLLASQDELSPNELKEYLKALKAVLVGVRTNGMTSLSSLPTNPGGRPQAFKTQQERIEAYKKLKKFQEVDRMPLKVAQTRLSTQTKATRRTIERLWQEESKRESNPPKL